MKRNYYFGAIVGVLLGHGLTSGILNPTSVSAAGAFIGAGLFGLAMVLGGPERE